MKKKFIKILTSCMIFSQIIGIHAYATTEFNSPNSKGFEIENVSDLTYTETLEASHNKEVLAETYMNFKTGKISEEDLINEATRLGFNSEIKTTIENISNLNEKINSKSRLTYDEKIQDKLNNTGGEPFSEIETYATSNILPGLVQTSQSESYYCGPATASMIIADKRSTPGQYALATALGTTSSEGTPWRKNAAYPMATVLNKYLYTDWYIPYPAVSNDSTRLTNCVVYSIDSGYGIAANVYEPVGGTYRLEGHPSDRNIEHWVAIDGYSSSGSTIHYAEPVYKAPSISWYKSVTNPYYNIANYKLSYIIWERGLIY